MPRFYCTKWYDTTSSHKLTLVSTTYSKVLDLTFESCGPNFYQKILTGLSVPGQPAYPQIWFWVCGIVKEITRHEMTFCRNEKEVKNMVRKDLSTVDRFSNFKCLISNAVIWQLFRFSSVDFDLVHKFPNSEVSETALCFCPFASHISFCTIKKL